MMRLLFWRLPKYPPATPEAVEARDEAKELIQVADIIYRDRAYLLRKNNFAERIRMAYEGGRH